MIPSHRLSLAALLPVAFALSATVATAMPTPPAAVGEARVAQDTTFKPEGRYDLNVAVEGQPMVMSFVVEKKADGTFVGVFRHSEMGEFGSTSFKVEGRKLTVGIETPGGPAMVVMTVQSDNAVEGEWSMAGDGSKISGKKTG